jgi:hypothetical protein
MNLMGFIREDKTNGNNNDNNVIKTISSKVLATIPASNIKLYGEIAVNNISINKDRRYYIEFLGSKKLCSLLINGEIGDFIICNIGNYSIEIYNNTFNISIYIDKINTSDTTDTFTDLIIYEEEVKYLDNKYLETDLTLQNSISLGRIGDIGSGSSAIGYNVEASGYASHAEGSKTTASGDYSHAEGNGTAASGDYGSHAEGSNTIARGVGSHAEGDSTTASAYCSHAEGNSTTASGENSHAEGSSTIASSQNQHVQGKYNIEDTNNKYAHIVGNGEDGKNSNAHTLDWEGNAWFAGKLTQEGTPTEGKDLTTKKYVDDKVKDTLVTTNISGTTLALTVNKYQTATVVDGTEITLPAVTSFTKIHLFFSTTADLTLTLPTCKWQNGNIPTISANKTYEFIFTYTTEWLGVVIVYG